MPLSRFWQTLEVRLARSTRIEFALIATAAALIVTLTVFAPRLQLWDLALAQPFETARAHSFLAQCEAPFRPDIEAAMRWRLLPPALCYSLGMRGWVALAVPWLGAIALLAACAGILDTEPEARGRALLGTILVATSSALLVPLGWLGMNDAWMWLGLLATAFAHRTKWATLACLLGPWVDERFLIGLPLALWVRDREHPQSAGWRVAIGVLPYLTIRLGFVVFGGESTSTDFLVRQLRESLTYLPYAPLGWWMAWRIGWVPVAVAWRDLWIESPAAARHGLLLMALTLGLSAVLAADLSRSAAILLPAVVWAWRRWTPRIPTSRIAWLVVAQVVVPAMHIVNVKTALISPLPLELLRLVRKLLEARLAT